MRWLNAGDTGDAAPQGLGDTGDAARAPPPHCTGELGCPLPTSRCHPRNNETLPVTRLSATPLRPLEEIHRLACHHTLQPVCTNREQIFSTNLLGRVFLEGFQQHMLQLHVSSLVHTVDVAESGSNGELLRDGRQFLDTCMYAHILGASPCKRHCCQRRPPHHTQCRSPLLGGREVRHQQRLLETQENQACLEHEEPQYLPKPRAILQTEAEQLACRM